MLKTVAKMDMQHHLKQRNNKPDSNDGTNGTKSNKGIKEAKQLFRS